ncbi:MAG: hypothetical protein IKI84_05390 [Clostridia bacterium]|nr:hypothetical protein [Clostridia bacterium]
MKNHGGQLEVTANEFDAELHRMLNEDTAAAELESIKGELMMLKKLKRRLEKITPELSPDGFYQWEQIPQAPEPTPERNTPEKRTEQKKHVPAR